MSYPAPTPEPLWLDRHLEQRLAARFGNAPGKTLRTLRLWQWEHLCRSLLCAAAGSAHYRQGIGPDKAAALLASAAARTGLPFSLRDAESGAPFRGRDMPGQENTERALALALADLPCTFPHELAAASEAFLAVSHSQVDGLISLPSSGSTGPGKRIFCTGEDLAQTAAFFRHGMQYMVLPGRGDSVALLMSGERPGSVGDLLGRGMKELGVPCRVPGFMAPGQEGRDAMLGRLCELKPSCLVGVPAQLLELARHEKAAWLAPYINSVLLSGDAVTPPLRQAIARGFGCELFVHYGLTETGLGGAVECRRHDGCHLREADILTEIVDENGKALPPGHYGEITLTTLTRQAMPLLRYRTGDEGRMETAACACGSVLGRLFPRGRMSERIPLPGGGCLHITDIERLLYDLPFIQGYAATLHTDGQGAPLCLALDIFVSRSAPADAQKLTEQRLARQAGLVPASSPADIAGQFPALPVLTRITARAQADDGDFRHSQAKKIIRRTQAPVGS